MAEKLLVVDKKDRIIGTESKEKCHQGRGILHRAFSILIFNKRRELLLTKRSKFKKLWPLFWDNFCSSHPLKGESYEVAGQKRLKRELGFSCKLKLVDKFFYQARYKNIGSENEICALLIGKYNSPKIKSDSKEIADWRWINLKELKKDIRKDPRKYTPWLKIDLKKINYRVIQNE
jgi:isopentenyl-diphosphate delta-isomerase